jgi:hypothetical protein
VDTPREPLLPAAPPPAKLPAPYSERLRAALLRCRLPRRSQAEIDEFLVAAEDLVVWFCDAERRDTRKPAGEIKRELQRSGDRLDSMREALRRFSDEVLQEIDHGCWPGEGMALSEEESHLRLVAELTELAKLRVPPPEGTHWSSYYRAIALLALDQLRSGIGFALTPITNVQVIGEMPANKGGPRRRLAWLNLAWRLGRAIELHLNAPLSPKPKALFERTLAACLTVGLQAIKSRRTVPGDLRIYTGDAVRIRAWSTAVSPSTTSTEKTPQK